MVHFSIIIKKQIVTPLNRVKEEAVRSTQCIIDVLLYKVKVTLNVVYGRQVGVGVF